MAKIEGLEKSYSRKGQKLIGKTHDLLIVDRSKAKQTGSRSAQYLLMLPKNGGKRDYVSSMYETESENVFRIDFQGVEYWMQTTPGKVEFHQKSRVYHRDFVSMINTKR
jgi:hypothetical protein